MALVKTETPPQRVDEQLVRAIGVPGLAANIVSSTIGAGIFVLPATVAAGLGAAAPLAFIVCAGAMIVFVTCFAIAGSRVSLTGGLYAYVEVAFGRYVGFLAGVLYGMTALGAVAGIVNVLANSIALIGPFLGGPVMRVVVMLIVYGGLVVINIRGVREGAGAVTIITVTKLLPLLLFIGVGIFFIHPANLTWTAWPGSKALGDAIIVLIFAFVGIEVALIPSGEVKNPTRTVPRAAYLALVVTTVIYIMIQLVAQGTLGPSLANYPDAPLAEAAANFLGNIGRTILLAGATISAFGFVTSDILSSPRMIFAFGRDGVLPRWFAHVHPRYRSPDVAIVTYAVLAFALSVTGTFQQLAVLSNVAVLLMYLLCCAACWFLVQRDVRADGRPFNFPGMKIVPVLAVILIVWLLVQSALSDSGVGSDTRAGLRIAAVLLAAGSVFYLVRTRWTVNR
ncbi:MAG: amino acid permease [Chthoniobacterales bacterium]|nr:MAG: amino acid permease [Chthoniobacterales bacterium]